MTEFPVIPGDQPPVRDWRERRSAPGRGEPGGPLGSKCLRVPTVGPAVPPGLAPCGSPVCGGGRWDGEQLGPQQKRSPDEQLSGGASRVQSGW